MNHSLGKDQINRNVEWLLANASPPVRYLTHCRLLGLSPESSTAKNLWQAVEQSETVSELFSKQQLDGSWCVSGPWAHKPSYIPKGGYSPFTPKHVTTVWVLMVLGEMGFRIGDHRIDQACEYVIAHQLPNGLFRRFAKTPGTPDWETQSTLELENAPCELSIYLRSLGSVGMTTDLRLAKSYELLVKWQRDDGGWALQKHLEERFKTRSCPSSTHDAAVALYQRGDLKYEPALRKALAFLVWHLSLKDVRKLRKFVFRGHHFLAEMLMFSDLGVGLAERPVQTILKWLMSMYDPEQGCFRYFGRKADATDLGAAGTRYWLFQHIEDDWLTYRMTRIAANLAEKETDYDLAGD
jgi:hypothetical protein